MSHVPQRNRFYHRLPVGMYQPGWHLSYHPDAQTRILGAMVFHYAYASWNDAAKKRKMQIAGKLVPELMVNSWGGQHLLDVAALDSDRQKMLPDASDLSLHPNAGPALALLALQQV